MGEVHRVVGATA